MNYAFAASSQLLTDSCRSQFLTSPYNQKVWGNSAGHIGSGGSDKNSRYVFEASEPGEGVAISLEPFDLNAVNT